MSPTPILHHYDFSPFSEKVRVAFGVKRLRWRSVIAPSVMPKPDLVALTGGYRHIPVMQVGADVYCDTRTIVRTLDRLQPEPPLDPSLDASRRPIRRRTTRRAIRGGSRRTADGTRRHSRPRSRQNRSRVRAHLPAVERLCAAASPWLLSACGAREDAPCKADLAVYHTLWFLGAFPVDCSHELDPHPATRAWMSRMASIGHGTPTPASAVQALEIAARSEPATPPATSPADDAMPALGTIVTVRPDGYATAVVEGTLVAYDDDDVTLARRDAVLGTVHVHLPRVGYAIVSRADT